MTNGRVNPAQELAHQGITGLGNVYYNFLEHGLVEEAVKRGEAFLSPNNVRAFMEVHIEQAPSLALTGFPIA